MNIKHYQAFLEYEEKGLKKQASESICAFVSSFKNTEDISTWVWENLPKLKKNNHSRIRHEIFNELVYPVLKQGYENNDFASTLWLGKLAQNIYQTQKIHKELNWVSATALYQKSHVLDPTNDEARLCLLKATIDWLIYAEHEWPSGILYGNNCATLEECDDINATVQQALELDTEQTYREFIQQFMKKLDDYKSRF